MHAAINCPHCSTKATIQRELLGQTVACPACGAHYIAQTEERDGETAAYQPCPHCGVGGRVKRSKFGRNTSCPRCGRVFTLQPEGAVAPSTPASAGPGAPAPPSPPVDGVLLFEGAWTTQVALLDKEQVLDRFEAGLMDVGPLPGLLARLPVIGSRVGARGLMVLTTHRLFVHEQRLFAGNRLRVHWLTALDGIYLGTLFRPALFAWGLAMLIYALWGVWVSVVLNVATSLSMMTPAAPGMATFNAWWGLLWLSMTLFYGAFGALGILILRTAWERGMYASAGGTLSGLQLAFTRSAEGQRFAEKVFTLLHYYSRIGGGK